MNDLTLRRAKPGEKTIRLRDERGLYLLVQPNGSRLWRMDYTLDGTRRTMSLGQYPDVGLAAARERREAVRVLVAAGIDPIEDREEKKAERARKKLNTFEAVAAEWLKAKMAGWVPEHAHNVRRSLECDVFPMIGARPIHELTAADVVAVLRRIEARGATDTLKRVRQRVSDVFIHAIAMGLIVSNPAQDLYKVVKAHRSKRRPALRAADLPEFFIRLDAVRLSMPVKNAIRLQVLTFLRPGELRAACWREIDLDAALWTVPAERDRSRDMKGMKMKEEHLVPLSRQVVAIFRELQAYSGAGELVFPNRNDPRRPMSDGTVNSGLRAMGYEAGQVVGSGFRATATGALLEMGFRRDVVDLQLSHRERNEVFGAYSYQVQYMDERVRMMQAWADHVDRLCAGADVVELEQYRRTV